MRAMEDHCLETLLHELNGVHLEGLLIEGLNVTLVRVGSLTWCLMVLQLFFCAGREAIARLSTAGQLYETVVHVLVRVWHPAG